MRGAFDHEPAEGAGLCADEDPPRHIGNAFQGDWTSGVLHLSNSMGYEERVTRFLSFCVEQFKHRHGGSGLSVGRLFSENGIFHFLSANFDVEHSLDVHQVLDDIELILRRKGAMV